MSIWPTLPQPNFLNAWSHSKNNPDMLKGRQHISNMMIIKIPHFPASKKPHPEFDGQFTCENDKITDR